MARLSGILKAMDTGKRGKTGLHLRNKVGALAQRWAGGRHIGPYGYIYVWVAPKTRRAEHRVVMEAHCGRPLKSSEIVHHKNGNRVDNRIENLEIMSRAEHIAEHRSVICKAMLKATKRKPIVCDGCGHSFIPKRRPRLAKAFCSKKCYGKRIRGH